MQGIITAQLTPFWPQSAAEEATGRGGGARAVSPASWNQLDVQALQFSKHRRNKLAHRRVYVNRPPDNGMQGMRVHDITGPVYGFVCIQTEERSSQNLAGVTCDDNLHKAMAVTVFNCAVDATMGRLSKSALRPARFTFWSVIPTRPRKVVWVSGPIAKACCRNSRPTGI